MDPEVSTTTTDDNADFAAGFAQPLGPTETPVDQGTQQGSEGADTKPADTPAAPEYVQITKDEWEALKTSAAEINSVKATLEKVSGTAFGKIGGIERTLKEIADGSKIDISQENIDALRAGGWPELAEPLEKLRNLRALPGAGGVALEQVEDLVQQRVAKVREELRIERQTELLNEAHPDWQQIDADPAFSAWTATLPEDERTKLAKASEGYQARVIADFMTRFKATRKAPSTEEPSDPQARRSRINAAVTPRGNGAHAPAETDDFAAGFREG